MAPACTHTCPDWVLVGDVRDNVQGRLWVEKRLTARVPLPVLGGRPFLTCRLFLAQVRTTYVHLVRLVRLVLEGHSLRCRRLVLQSAFVACVGQNEGLLHPPVLSGQPSSCHDAPRPGSGPKVHRLGSGEHRRREPTRLALSWQAQARTCMPLCHQIIAGEMHASTAEASLRAS